MWTWPRNNIKPTIPLVAFSCSAEYVITFLNNSDGKSVDLVSGSLVSHREKMIILSRLQASVSLAFHVTAFISQQQEDSSRFSFHIRNKSLTQILIGLYSFPYA